MVHLYKLALHKSYFDKGYGITSYLKYMIAFFGLASNDIKSTMLIGVSYMVSCYFIGMVAYKIGYVEAEQEISNVHNKFVKDMRKSKLLNSSPTSKN